MLAHSGAAAGADISPCVAVYQQEHLSGTPKTLYAALQATARQTGEARGYVASTTHVTVHCPLEVVALSLGKHRVTIWRAAKVLGALGLIDARPHKCTALNGRTVNSGTLWAVRLNPDEGSPAKLTYEELTHAWRDLDRDRRRGRTAYRAARDTVQLSKALPQCGYDLELLLAWTMPPQPTENPVTSDSCTGARRDLESILDVPHAERGERAAMVDAGAHALAQTLRDRRGLNFYRLLLWQLLRAADRGTEAPFYQVYLAAQRARTDAAEGFARSPGALFTSRLKSANWYAEVMRGPSVRVGTRPVALTPPE